MVVLKSNKKKDDLDEESDSDDVEDPVTTEVPGGEKEIGEEVLRFTKDAHNKRVDLVKTKATLEYEIKTIRTTIIRYKTEIKKTTEIVTTTRTEITEETSKLESLKTSSISASLKEADKKKIEGEIGVEQAKVTEKQQKITRFDAALIDWKNKMASLIERRKQIKFITEVKVLEAKEAEQAVMEAIKTVTDVELLNRKRWIASKSVGDFKKCNKFMAEYKMIYDKQNTVLNNELADHKRRIEVANGAISSLEEK